ncbi:HNH endonuclease [Cellulomonas sp. C5510]|uniref:HNH endonuclease n=1 Tax=Cellulomonas sp. C5510 TaxID=2871170 RepID=UPI00351D5444
MSCQADDCPDRSLLWGLCAYHAALAHAATLPACEASCGRTVFSGLRCHVHTRAQYRRHLPPRTDEQIEEELVGSRLLRALHRWRERKWHHGRAGQALAPVYRDGYPNRLLATLLALLWDGQCHLCGGPLNADTPAGHPLALTVDHVRPRAAGGVHVVSNLAPAHLVCNIAKGDRALARHARVRVPSGRLRGARKAAVVRRDWYGRRVIARRQWS